MSSANHSLIQTGLILELNLQKDVKGPLNGCRVAVKDLFDIAGCPTSAGNPDWLKTHAIPDQTASAVENLLNAGVQVIGKSLTDELAYSLNGVNVHYGTPLNHRAPDRLPGGSTSGSAVAVAGGVADVGLGTDTGGSIRVPASYNALYGIRTTHSVIPMDNMVPLAPAFDTVGWLTRDLDTLVRVGEVLLPSSEQDPHWTPHHLMVLKPEISGHQLADSAFLSWVEGHAHHFRSVQFCELHSDFFQKVSQTFRILQGAEIVRTHGEWLEKTQPVLAVDIQERLDWCRQISDEDVLEAQKIRTEVVAQIDRMLPDDDWLMCLPTTPGAAPLLSADKAFMDTYRIQLMGLTGLAGLSSRPQVHLPVLTQEQAPWGVSFIGPKNKDLALMKFLKAFV